MFSKDVADDYRALLRHGNVERFARDPETAESWRAFMRKNARGDRLRLVTLAGNPSPDGFVYVFAHLRDRPATDEEQREVDELLRQAWSK